MTALLDAVGAVAVGGMILLSLISGMYNIQVYSYNTKMQATLTTTSEIASAALQDRYLSALGLVPTSLIGIADPDSMIISASRKTLQFYAEIDGSIQIVTIQQGAQNTTTSLYPLEVQLGANTDFGSFATSVENIFTFYDENNAIIHFASNSIPNGHLDDIRSVKVEISFALRGLAQITGGNRNLMNKIVFWQFFKNQYL